MRQLFLLLFFIMTALCCDGQQQTTVSNVDLERYMGRWYELARYDHRFERNLTQCEAFYTLMPDGRVSVRNTGYNTRTGRRDTSLGRAKLGKHPGQLRVSFFLFFYSDYNIMALGDDYDWALVGSRSPKYLWILSRTPSLPDATINHILDIARSRGYDVDKLIWVAH